MEKISWIFVIREKHEIKYTTKLFTYTVYNGSRGTSRYNNAQVRILKLNSQLNYLSEYKEPK